MPWFSLVPFATASPSKLRAMACCCFPFLQLQGSGKVEPLVSRKTSRLSAESLAEHDAREQLKDAKVLIRMLLEQLSEAEQAQNGSCTSSESEVRKLKEQLKASEHSLRETE